VPDTTPPPSLRAEQVAQTRAALVAAGRHLFGQQGFTDTSVEDLAREARVTTGALYHHFPTKTALFETVFEQIHEELLDGSTRAGVDAPDIPELITRALEWFLDAILDPELQQIIVTDAPAVLGVSRFTELDERSWFGPLVTALEAARDGGQLRVDDPETLARLLMGALTRGAMLIASASDPITVRDAVATTVRSLVFGLAIRTDGHRQMHPGTA
jgi:AcrR family transcriptional regulator